MKEDEFSSEDEVYQISQWANEVLEFSSAYGSSSSISYSAVNICGRTSRFPSYGDFAECFMMRKYGPAEESEFSIKDQSFVPFHDFIVIKYEHFAIPKEIKIFETYNPGSVIRIFAYCELSRKWSILWDSECVTVVEQRAREFNPPIRNINLPTRILRIEFNHSLLDYYTGIDGVLFRGIKWTPPSVKPPSELTIIKGIIQKKLENVHFKPEVNVSAPSESMENFFKNDLSKFIEETACLASSSNESQNIIPIVQHQANKKEKIISDLPYEVLFNIFTFLNLKSLYRASQVCKSFQRIAIDPLLYLEVNLKFYWNLVNSSLLESLEKRCTLIKKLDLSSCGCFGSLNSKDFVNFIRANGKSLTHLRLNSSNFLNTSCFDEISWNCKNLKELSIQNYINTSTERDLANLSMLSELLVLDLSKTGIDSETLLHILKNNRKLQRLNVAFSSQNVSIDEVCVQISHYSKAIRSIDFWKCYNLTTVGLRALAECSMIEELDIGWCMREDPTITESLKILLQNCKNLKKLVLAAVRSLSERDLENIANFCEKLEHLEFCGIVGVSRGETQRILEQCQNLSLLDVSFCENIDEETVFQWRNRFKRVFIKRSCIS